MTRHEDILRKISACLALAQSDNPHEAAAALARAQELMEKYGVSHDDVAISDVSICTADSRAGRVPPKHIVMLARMVALAFGVAAVYRPYYLGDKWRARFEFYGTDASPKVAAYTYEVLERQLTKSRTAYIGSLNKRLKRNTKVRRGDMYASGWVQAVSDKITPRSRTETEAKAIKAYEAKQFGDGLRSMKGRDLSTKARNHDYGALVDGMADGSNVEFRQGVAGERQKVLAGGGAGS
ncbi:DUF2786 domain-containing protein [Thalassospira marina]|uniref:DUF2786 domain-containing protein n=1 Tax=Thalassospira marina TaxID=2048283 RepID=A0ABM6QBT0_9PROT|nr:DUF2786 domain-containing protein [Thalassospira marina]AUG53918.1 hypothetical protein CSC3H3_15235 [Thalassospira marina]